jgi:glycosyltransferase involved in cell wall biosynthesis
VIVPDTTPLEKFDERRAQRTRKPTDRIRLGWVGSPQSSYNLFAIWEALEELWKRHPDLELRLVGAGPDYHWLPPFERVNASTREVYGEAEMIDEVLDMHIGLFPQLNVERSRVRGVLKAAVYMSGEAAVVASPVGQCVDIIEDGVNGMLAASTSEWLDKLERLITDESLRRRVAYNGLETVRSRFQRSQSLEILKDVLFPIANRGREPILSAV